MRALSALIDHHDPALPLIIQCAGAAAHPSEILDPSADRETILHWLQVTTRSHIGSIAYATGGLLIDHGWLRVLGSGHLRFPRNIRDWNTGRSVGFMLVADDVVGGFFALNGGALGGDAGALYYWAPDTLAWEPLGMGYGAFIEWAFGERLEQFYRHLRWPGWQADIAGLSADQCMSFYPFLWTEEGSVQDSTRGVTSMAERYKFNRDLVEQLNGG